MRAVRNEIARAARSRATVLVACVCLVGAVQAQGNGTVADSATPSGGPAQRPLTPAQMALARKLYLTRCAKCHKMYDPAKYSDPQWRVWMIKMEKKAKLQPEQKVILREYIDQILRHPATVDTNVRPR